MLSSLVALVVSVMVGAGYPATPPTIVRANLPPEVVGEATDQLVLNTRYVHDIDRLNLAVTVTHELTHLLHDRRGYTVEEDLWEEAAAESTAQDLAPVLQYRMYGWRMVPLVEEAYPVLLHRLRACSVRQTGARVQSWEARNWRRTFTLADNADRAVMRAGCGKLAP